ncbi:hypothetical protein DFH08DRAFT_809353 [Mycena albidolilacea]|uniref:Uncharacterized protein n=1 Tax=Mycena albidolilacea TaxID=1033008 RepID=A0AAD7A1I1_9AGAR|nr:hypothetical protein DFH08DRAFT_809353 [Mycena albidolilacea]
MQQVVSVARPNRKQHRPSKADAALEAGEDEIGFLADFPPLIPAEPKKKWTSPIYSFFSNVTIVHKDDGSRYHLFKNMKVTLSAASEQALTSASPQVRKVAAEPDLIDAFCPGTFNLNLNSKPLPANMFNRETHKKEPANIKCYASKPQSNGRSHWVLD